MKYIEKNSPPAELVAYRSTPNASYRDLSQNPANRDTYEVTRLSLAEEQGYLCCYCGKRITGFKGTQIEHLFPKGTKAYERMQLDYENNLIASCDGGKFQRKMAHNIPANQLHCDTKKSNDPIPVTPLQKTCEDKFLYDVDGTVLGVGADAEATIELLNLDSPLLNTERKSAILSLTQFPVQDWKQEYERLGKKNTNGEYTEFCFVLRTYIELTHANDIK